MTALLFISTSLLILGLVSLFVGLVTPGWTYWYINYRVQAYGGLWYSIVCDHTCGYKPWILQFGLWILLLLCVLYLF